MERSAETDASVTSLGEARAAREPSSNLRCADCGSEWFKTSVVIDAATMRVTGYAADFTCEECGGGDVA